MLLAALMAVYLLVLTLLTQSPDEAVNMLLLMGGAVLLAPGFPVGWQPRPGLLGRWLGLAFCWRCFGVGSGSMPLISAPASCCRWRDLGLCCWRHQ